MFDDRGHRPHADFKGQEPTTEISRGPEALSVRLVKWGPKEHIAYMYNALQANWGDAPSQIVEMTDHRGDFTHYVDESDGHTLTEPEWRAVHAYVAKCFAGGTLPQILEELRFHFVIDGVSRACTHQLVRTRGADVMQHGGRDNDWRMRGWTMPETIARACDCDEKEVEDLDLLSCITDWAPIFRLLIGHAKGRGMEHVASLRGVIEEYLWFGKDLYAALVDAGIPWQDARRLLWMGTQTYLHIGYNYLDLQRTLANRLEHIMDWEFNCVAQLMLREVRMACPSYMWEPLKSVSDKAQKAMFAGLTSWPPDGKWPIPDEVAECLHCGQSRETHFPVDGGIEWLCDSGEKYSPVDGWLRAHRPEQMPFWVLSTESMNGGPIRWIPTNGTYPEHV